MQWPTAAGIGGLLRNCKGAVLVTGGLGGLGIVTAEALVEAGAQCVVLASRSGKVKHSDQGLESRLESLRGSGTHVVLAQCDTSNEAEVESMLSRVRTQHGPLHVIVHAAGTLSDKALVNQDPESMRRVWGPKANGAWFLHEHTVGHDSSLGAFVLFSSIASLLGSVGQANYSAANAYLDELAQWRVCQGLPGVSIQWPAVSGVGMAAALDERVQIDGKLTIDARVVKQVASQVLSMTVSSAFSAVQAVIPRTMFEEGAHICWNAIIPEAC